ncbi:MAG: hypothetical protein IPI79_09295 [Moraxellaceae bacterium]|nr:hypothetical protein [Moraxellaceae bacterium]
MPCLTGKAKLSTFAIFARQERGDWGDVDIEDAMTNEQALILRWSFNVCL